MLKKIVRKKLSPEFTRLETKKLLIAVSGGSDSMALLHLCAACPEMKVYAATLDHGLRPEAVDEAQWVGTHCRANKISHATLTWRPEHPSQATSQTARQARYELLAQHAKEIGATAIVLGHTLDDQAETILMRTRRMKPYSSTRGLSGMPEVATYGSVKLLRPLLTVRRADLRNHLDQQSIDWLDDPSNEKTEYERVRTRNTLKDNQHFPSLDRIGQLAAFSRRQRNWLNSVIALHIRDFVRCENGVLVLQRARQVSDVVVTEMFLVLILTVGGRDFRVSDKKIADIVRAFQQGGTTRKAVGNCLISTSRQQVRFSKEIRNSHLPQLVMQKTNIGPRVDPAVANKNDNPVINALNYFRPASDDSVYEALMGILETDR